MRNTCLALGLLVLSVAAGADRGSIPFLPDVEIFEPNQRAMIAWNGDEEILLLSTDLHASKPTKVLEVIPLPAEPKVKKGDVETFRKATALINERQLLRTLAADGTRSRSGYNKAPAGEITFHDKIGAHDISVSRVNDPRGFVAWVNKYLKRQGVARPVVSSVMRSTIEEYMKDGYRWFVFDVVELDDKPKTNDAIQYRFKSDALYYPLRISRTDNGMTKIDLLILTPRLLSVFPGLASDRIELKHDPITITAEELRSLSPDMDELLGHREEMKLRIWEVSGDLASFDRDLLAR